MNRRLFLRGAGGVTLAAPALLTLREARGDSAAAPRRLVIFYQRCGTITDKWWPELQDGPLTEQTLVGTSLEVMSPFYKKLLLPRGFRSMNQYAMGQTIDPHDQANGSKLTCAKLSDNSNRYATAESLDHTVARQINPGGGAPLVLSAGYASSSIKEVISFSAAEQAFPATTNPLNVYNLLVEGIGAGTEADYRLRRNESAIDLVRDDLEQFQKLDMSRADQQRIEDWLDLLRDTEVGLTAACTTDTATKLGITLESVTAASPIVDRDAYTDEEAAAFASALATSFTAGSDMMMNLMALSMICDRNRAMILTFPAYVVFNWDGIEHTHDHDGIAHRTGGYSVGGACMDGNVVEMLLQIDRWYAKKYARLVGLLDSVDEGSGTLLDNSAVMLLNEFSDGGAMNVNNLPILIAGGAGGYLKQGYAVNVEGEPLDQGRSSLYCNGNGGTIGATGSSGGNVPINKLYVTLMNAVGCTEEGDKVTSFGVFDGMTTDSGISDPGEIAALTAQV